MKITAIYDNGGKTLDRYTVMTDEVWDKKRSLGVAILESYNALGLAENGQGFSQWTEAIHGKHLGKRVKFEDLSAEMQTHIAYRVLNIEGKS